MTSNCPDFNYLEHNHCVNWVNNRQVLVLVILDGVIISLGLLLTYHIYHKLHPYLFFYVLYWSVLTITMIIFSLVKVLVNNLVCITKFNIIYALSLLCIYRAHLTPKTSILPKTPTAYL